MLPDGTGYLMGQELPRSTVAAPTSSGRRSTTAPPRAWCRSACSGVRPASRRSGSRRRPTMFEVTSEPVTGSETPGDDVVLRGEVA